MPLLTTLEISPDLDLLSDPSLQDQNSEPIHNTSEDICLTLLLSSRSMEPQNPCELISASSPIHMASMYGQTKSVQLLLSLGADIHAGDGDGRTALHLAVMSNHQSTVHLLLLQGANTHALGLSRRNALCYVAERGLDDLILMLVQYGAPIQ
jgi:ankyrin repeat protein